jgi:hypothetical protein
MSFDDESNVNTDPLKTKVDAITAFLVVVVVGLIFTLIMLGVSHQSLAHRLDYIEQALMTAQK